MARTLTFAQAINEALSQAMEMDDSVICYGLGVPDPKGVFGTTLGLQERFGSDRVFDMHASENAMTGVTIGASLNGIRPVMTHQRVDFFLLKRLGSSPASAAINLTSLLIAIIMAL